MAEFRVLVADAIGAAGMEALEAAADIGVDRRVGLSKEELIDAIGDYHAVIVRSATTLDRDVIAAGTQLVVIGRAGVGVDNIDVAAATKRGVVVMNTPQANSIATAEQTMALMLAAARHTAHAHASVSGGDWSRSQFTGTELASKTLGIIGFGRVGRAVAARARAFEMNVVAFDPYVTELAARDEQVTLVELDDLLATSDFVSLHCGLSDQTRRLMNGTNIAKMKPGAVLVNAARGDLVDEAAAAAALSTGRLRAVAIDVFGSEPPAADHPLIGLPNVVHTPHLGASTEEAQRDVALQVALQVIDALRGEGVVNSVNFPYRLDPETAPWVELAMAIGKLQFAMAPEPVRRVEIEAIGDGVSRNIRTMATGVLAGLLTGFIPDGVNLVNAPSLAADHGIAVSQSERIGNLDYPNMLSVRASWDDGDRVIAGVVFGGREPRIVQVSRYHLDAKPKGTILLMLNNDVPGVIGEVGTLLGSHDVNIAEWRLGRDEIGGHALSFINLDEWPADDVIDQLRALSAVEKAMVVEL